MSTCKNDPGFDVRTRRGTVTVCPVHFMDVATDVTSQGDQALVSPATREQCQLQAKVPFGFVSQQRMAVAA